MTIQQLNAIGVTKTGFEAYKSFCFLCKVVTIGAIVALIGGVL